MLGEKSERQKNPVSILTSFTVTLEWNVRQKPVLYHSNTHRGNFTEASHNSCIIGCVEVFVNIYYQPTVLLYSSSQSEKSKGKWAIQNSVTIRTINASWEILKLSIDCQVTDFVLGIIYQPKKRRRRDLIKQVSIALQTMKTDCMVTCTNIRNSMPKLRSFLDTNRITCSCRLTA